MLISLITSFPQPMDAPPIEIAAFIEQPEPGAPFWS